LGLLFLAGCRARQPWRKDRARLQAEGAELDDRQTSKLARQIRYSQVRTLLISAQASAERLNTLQEADERRTVANGKVPMKEAVGAVTATMPVKQAVSVVPSMPTGTTKEPVPTLAELAPKPAREHQRQQEPPPPPKEPPQGASASGTGQEQAAHRAADIPPKHTAADADGIAGAAKRADTGTLPVPDIAALEPQAESKLDTAVPRRPARATIPPDHMTSTVLTPPIFLQAMDGWARQVLGDPMCQPGVSKVAWTIHLHLNREAGEAWPSVLTIARRTALPTRTVFVALNSLEARGHIKRDSGGGKTSNRYRLLVKTQPVKRGSPVKQAAPTREAGFTAPVKQASPEPLTESLIKPQHARSPRGDQEVINQEKGSKAAVEQESGGQENRALTGFSTTWGEVSKRAARSGA
jgi:hypothetical protein